MKSFNDVIDMTLAIKDSNLAKEFYGLILSKEEQADIVKRLAIMYALLDQNLSQREIAKKLGISITKITRGSHNVKKISKKLRAFLKKHPL